MPTITLTADNFARTVSDNDIVFGKVDTEVEQQLAAAAASPSQGAA